MGSVQKHILDVVVQESVPQFSVRNSDYKNTEVLDPSKLFSVIDVVE